MDLLRRTRRPGSFLFGALRRGVRRRRLNQNVSLERLEDRTLLASAGLANGVLVFNNDGIETNDLHVSSDGTDLMLRDANNEIVAGNGVNPVSGDPNAVTIPLSDITHFQVNSHAGDDTLTVDYVSLPITYDGGDGHDTLVIEDTAGNGVDELSYTPGPATTAGRLDYTGSASGEMVIDFLNLEPVIDAVPASILTINATNGDNAINYTQGDLSPIESMQAAGLVSVDGFEVIHFTNKGALVLNGNAGSDTININNPTVPDGLTQIAVNGHDPTGSDTLIVNGVVGSADGFHVLPLGQGAGSVIYDGTALPPVSFTGTEHLTVVGHEADGDALQVEGTASQRDDLEFTPGATPDAGLVVGSMSLNATPFPLVPTTFTGMAGLSLTSSFQTGGADTLVYNGIAGNDDISLIPSTIDPLTMIRNDRQPVGELVIPVTTDAADLTIRGNAGADAMRYLGRTGIRVELDRSLIQDAGFSELDLFYEGVEVIDLDTRDSTESITIEGTGAADNFVYARGVFGDGNVRVDGFNTTFIAANSNLVLNGSFGGDHLSVEGSGGNDQFLATANMFAAGFGGAEYFNFSSMSFNGYSGNDTLVVDNTLAPVFTDITFNGADGDDLLELTGETAVAASMYTPGPSADEGTVQHLNANGQPLQDVHFTGLEPVLDLVVAADVIVNGTDADNAINYTAGKMIESEEPGEWTFTGRVTVDGFERFDFANKRNLHINAGAGSDTISIASSTVPTGMNPLTSLITVDGGDPGGSDTVVVHGQEGVQDVMAYLPTAQNTGTVRYVSNNLPEVDLTATEHLTIVGQTDDSDNLAVVGTAGNDVIEFLPGATRDAGMFVGTMSNSFPMIPMQYTGMSGQLPVAPLAGSDFVIFNGTSSDDNIGFANNIISNSVSGHAVRLDTATEHLALRGHDGDDSFSVHQVTQTAAVIPTVRVEGNNASNNTDRLEYVATGTTTLNLQNSTIDSAAAAIPGEDVRYSGIDELFIRALPHAVNVLGTGNDDDIRVTFQGSLTGRIEQAAAPLVVEYFSSQLTINTGPGEDRLTVTGNAVSQLFDVNVPAGTVAVDDVNNGVGNDGQVTFLATESLRVLGQDGQDSFNVTPGDGIPVSIDGGDPIGLLQQPIGDVLNVNTDGRPFLYQPGPEADEGSFNVRDRDGISFDHIELLQVDNVNYILPDRYDQPDVTLPPNDSVATATNLGSERTVIERQLTLHDTGAGINADYFKITAHETGKMIFNVFFSDDIQRGLGDVDIRVLDANGTPLAASISVTDNEKIVIPVVSQEMYFLEVIAANDLPNIYNLEIENFAAPVPTSVLLNPADDSGMMNNDNVTNAQRPTFLIQSDLRNFGAMFAENPIPNPSGLIDSNGAAGADVDVTITGVNTGLTVTGSATRVGMTTLWTFMSPIVLPEDLYFINAATTITDGALVTGSTQFSDPLFITVDRTPAMTTGAPDLLASSDTGMHDDDNVTSKMQPAFDGQGEANNKVRVLANGVVVGNGVVTSGGEWEVTVEPLRDGNYAITYVLEDLAGNVSDPSEPLMIEIDTFAPNTPYLDLLNDTGHSDRDNITSDNNPRVSMTTEDPHSGNHVLFTDNLKYRIFDRYEGDEEFLLYTTTLDPAVFNNSDPNDLFTALQHVAETLPLSQVNNAPPAVVNGRLADGVHNLKLEVEDRAGNISHDFLLTIVVDTVTPDADQPDLLASSDTGMHDDDNVTSKMSPAFEGVSEVNADVRVFARNVLSGATHLVGEGRVGTDNSDGVPDDGMGLYEVTVEPMADGTYDVFVEIEDWAGNLDTSDPLRIEIDTFAPNTPYLDLLNDTGHSDKDNITSDNDPRVSMTTEDPHSENHILFSDNLKYRIFDRYEGAEEFLLYTTTLDPEIYNQSDPADLFTALRHVAETLPLSQVASNPPAVVNGRLADGLHNLKLEVEDRAGNISHDFLLTIEIDTETPIADVPDLLESSDTGMNNDDNVTRLIRPAFDGISEINADVRVYATNVVTGTTQQVGFGTVGTDNSDGVPNDGMGRYEVTVEPLADGTYDIHVEIEDWAGNLDTSDPLTIEIDTFAPNTPYLDLLTDTGHSDTDNITADNDPRLSMTTEDPHAANHILFTDNLKYRIFDRYEGDEEFLLYTTTLDPLVYNLSDPSDLFTSLNRVAETVPLSQVPNNHPAVVDGKLADGVHNLKLEVEDRAGNISHDFLLTIQIDTVTPVADAPNLLESSDTGMHNDDNVTSLIRPAFDGISEINADVRVYATNVLTGTTQQVGFGTVGTDNSDGVANDGMGRYEVTVEPLADGTYDIHVEIEDWAGNLDTSDALTIEIDTFAPNTPYLDLLTDTGHSDTDNITSENRPRVSMTTEDPHAANHVLFSDNLKYRIFDRYEGDEEFLLYTTTLDPAVFNQSDPADLFTSLNRVAETLPLSQVADNQPAVVDGRLADGVHNLKLEVEDRAGNISHDFLLTIEIDSTVPVVGDIDLLSSSDTGMHDDDNVTRLVEPAFMGVSEVGATVRIYAQDVFSGTVNLVGENVIGSDDSDVSIGGVNGFGGADDDGFGLWEITVEPLDDSTYDIFVEVEDWAGNIDQSDRLRVEIDSTAPNTPFLDLLNDSGRSDQDNITNRNEPRVYMTTEDPNSDLHILFSDNLKFRIFDRYEETPEFLLYTSTLDPEIFRQSDPSDLFTSLTKSVETLPLSQVVNQGDAVVDGRMSDGVHNLKLEVEDRAGNISEDFLLSLVIDTQAPDKSFGDPNVVDDGLVTDTGVTGYPEFSVDRITATEQPRFFGAAEADAIIRAFVVDGRGDLVQIGQTVATPLDGNQNGGAWELDAAVNLNDPDLGLGQDGRRRIRITAEDVAGNISAEMELEIFIDSQGPRLYDPPGVANAIQIVGAPDFDLFALKPDTEGPTPAVNGLLINVEDLPERDAAFLYEAIVQGVAEQPLHYSLVGESAGPIAITGVVVNNLPPVAGETAKATIRLTFAAALPDDRYTLTIKDTILDRAGNAFDGDGDGVPGGDFITHFTVDSRPDLGVVGNGIGKLFIDANGNGVWDPAGTSAANHDLAFELGESTDAHFVGQFTDNGNVDGFDRFGAYGFVDGAFRWLLDFDNDGVADHNERSHRQIDGLPVAGDFDRTRPGDEIGLFTGTRWYLDTTGNNNIGSNDLTFGSNMRGRPIAGDFDGDGRDDLGSYVSSTNTFFFDLTTADDGSPGELDGRWDDQMFVNFNGSNERPFAGDFNLDGIDDVGIMIPDQDGVSPDVAEWYVFVSDAVVPVAGTVNTLDTPFSPTPLGNDLFFEFGSNIASPVVGNIDPPPAPTGDDQVTLDGRILRITGTAGNDAIDINEQLGQVVVTLNGTRYAFDGDDVGRLHVEAGDGNDTVRRLGDSDRQAMINGGDGDDVLQGGRGRDILIGARGDDLLNGGAGRDALKGGIGNDVLNGGEGDDNLIAASGHDVLNGEGGDDLLKAGTGTDQVFGGFGADSLYGENGRDVLRAGAGDDTAIGGGGDDVIFGEAGNDRLRGGNGHDVLDGGIGQDDLDGGNGRDVVIGGEGSDILVATTADDIAVAGYTTLDTASLQLVSREWRSRHTYDNRVLNLRDGSGSTNRKNEDAFLMAGSTVFDDGAVDRIDSDSASDDWFFASLADDTISNRDLFEVLDEL